MQNALLTFVVLTFLLAIDGLFLIPTASRGSIKHTQIHKSLYMMNFILRVQFSNQQKFQYGEDC